MSPKVCFFRLLIYPQGLNKEWRESSKFDYEEIVNLRRRTHFRAFPPEGTEKAGGSRINFAAPASKKLSPTIAVYLGGIAPQPVEAKGALSPWRDHPL